MNYLDKAWFLLKDKYMEFVIKSPLVNHKINKLVHRISAEEELQLNLPIETLHLQRSDYDSLLNFKPLETYKKFPYQHRKLLEYATSFKILSEHDHINSFCDFASGGDAYSKYVRYKLNKDISIYSIDPLNENTSNDGIKYIKGNTSSILLPDNSIDIITCHHSIEHFRENEDSKAIEELTRILKPEGLLLILPVFLCDKYMEISNIFNHNRYDETSEKIRDIFSPFPGWGKYEYFARVYNIEAFKRRIISKINQEKFDVRLLHIYYENKDIPDIGKNRSLPEFCKKMLVLKVTKKTGAP